MTGGKRLTEEERKIVLDALRYDSFADAIAIIEKDDEPEYCTCNKPSDHSVMEHRQWICGHCGKPVRGE